MLRRLKEPLRIGTISLALLGSASWATAAAPTVDQALKLVPMQKDLEYHIPTADEIKSCNVKGEKQGEHSAWVVRDAAGQILRRFVDTNGDNIVDQWCYYRDGIEVYRDIDKNFNGKADQYRWVNTAGSRFGTDDNEDGKIDSWKNISAEEVTYELIRALADQDAARFSRLLLTEAELRSLGLGADREKELAAKLKAAPTEFAALARRQTMVVGKSAWINFGATRPGLVPEGTEGSTKDLVVYENALAMIETGGKHGQVHVGTLVRVGELWRLVEAPQIAEGKTDLAEAGIFFKSPAPKSPSAAETAASPAGRSQRLLVELEALDKTGDQALTSEAQLKFNTRRADLLEQLAAEATTAEDRAQWISQLADTVSAAAQSGGYPSGVTRLQALYEKLAVDAASKELTAYVKFRYLSAEYAQSIQAPKADFPKIQTKWLADLEQYVSDYPDSSDAAEAMMQLGVAQEFAGQEEDAKKWYNKISARFPTSNPGKKAAGAIKRLDCVGQSIRISGKSSTGQTVDLSQFKGKVVLLHYWATWCEPCVSDIGTIKQLYAKHGAAGFIPLGINLDANNKAVVDFLKTNKLSWPQLLEPGSLDGRLANELGIMTLPTMILIDKDGRVLNRNINMTEVEAEVKKRATGNPAGSGTARRPGT